MSNIHKCLIIGSGPAGYTAAIYAARAEMNPVVFTGKEPGGQLTITTEVENFPGYPNGVQGPELVEDLRKQAERFGTVVRYEQITKVDFSEDVKKIWTESGEELQAHSVIVATGASAKWLGLESEQTFMNRGVSACAVCDGFFFRGQEVAVVGGGDTAAEEATYLSKLCPKVHLIVRKGEMRASKVMQERVINNPKIEIHWHSTTDEIFGDENGVTSVQIHNHETNTKIKLAVTGFFVAIGHQPNTQIFSDILDMDDAGYLLTVPGSTRMNIGGIFACGDAQDNTYRQAVTAAGTGCMAALDAERYLASHNIH